MTTSSNSLTTNVFERCLKKEDIDKHKRSAGELQRGFFTFRGDFERPNCVYRQMAPQGAVCIAGATDPMDRIPIENVRLQAADRGGFDMALNAGGRRFCKVVHSENGRTWTRRIHTMTVQAADGRLHQLEGVDLPDSISLYSGVPHSGAHLAEVLLSPKDAKATPKDLSAPTLLGPISLRDGFFLLLGMFGFGLIFFLSEHAAIALS